jgi:hypothetical protein
MKKLTIAIIFLCLICSIVNAQDAMSFNGTFWDKMTNDGKIVFLLGMIQGEYIGQKLLYDWGETLLLDQTQVKLEDSRTIQQVVDSIDLFYKDNPKKDNYPVCLVYLLLLDATKVK